MSSNAKLHQTIAHVDESSTTSDILARHGRTLVLVIAVAAFLAAAWAAMLPSENADIPRSVSFQDQRGAQVTGPDARFSDIIAPSIAAGAAETTARQAGAPTDGSFDASSPIVDDALPVAAAPEATTQESTVDGVQTIVAAA
jgi:hypothetical protein